MIINGASRRAGGWWAKHLKDAEKNERVTLAEIVGLDASTIPDLFREMEILARNSGSKTQNYFYQANVNPREGEILTPEQRHEAKELLLKNLGLDDQPHFVVEHEKEGRVHFHVIAFRIDMERGRAISDSLTAQIHERTARELEIRFDLERGKSILVPDRDSERPDRGAKKHEVFRGAEGGIDPEIVKADARRAWEVADSGVAFKAALEASSDYILARGDRRDYVIIDREGDDHSLARRLGEKVKAIRERMADLDPASLPSVEQAKALQHKRHPERAPEPTVIKEPANQNMPEPVAVIFDRDAANRAADDRIIEAAIKQAASAPQENRQQPAPGAAIGTQSEAAGPAQAPPQTAAREEAPGVPAPELIEGIEAALGAGKRAARQGLAGLATAVEKALSGFFSFFGGGEPKETPQQMHDRVRADTNEETLHARAYAADVQAREADQDDRIFEMVRQQRHEMHRAEMGYADEHGSSPASRAKEREDNERDRD